MFGTSEIDASNIPQDYLESYPYPALILIAPIPPPAIDPYTARTEQEPPFTRSTHFHLEPLSAFWTNSKWKRITQGRELLDCISVDEARRLGTWITGQLTSLPRHDAESDRTASSSSATRRTRDLVEALEDTLIRTTLSSPAEDKSEGLELEWESADRQSQAPDTNGTLDEQDTNSDPPTPLTIQISQPGTMALELTKTPMPIWRYPHGSSTKTRVASHSFIVITTVPKSKFVPNHGGVSSPTATSCPFSTQTEQLLSVPGQSTGPSSSSSRKARGKILDKPKLPSNRLTQLSEGSISSRSSSTRRTSNEEVSPVLRVGDDSPIILRRDNQRTFPVISPNEEGKSWNVHELLKTTDWSKTSLGPMDQWPQSLKTIVSLVMQYPQQCCLWWGKDFTLIYNQAYAEAIHKHPSLFGMSGPVAWAEIWSSLGPVSEHVLKGTSAFKEEDFLLFKQLPHQGTGTFEVYHSWMWVPVRQEDGTVGGLWNATIDSTTKVLAERRLNIVREMGDKTSLARTMSEFNSAVIDILETNPRDVPFALLYNVDVAPQDVQESVNASGLYGERFKKVTLTMSGSIGVPKNHPHAPTTFSLNLSSTSREASSSSTSGGTFTPGGISLSCSPTPSSLLSGISTTQLLSTSDDDDDGPADSWMFREALQTKRLVLIDDCSSLIEGFPVRVWDELPKAAVVVPISNDSDDGVPLAVFVIGLNVRRPFDDDYEAFIHVLRLQLASGLAAAKACEAEQQRIEDLAALDRAKSLLFSNVSHELRTPLTLVAGPLDDLLAETAKGPKRELLVMARRNVRRLTRLVSTLMDVSRLEAGRLKGSFCPVNLGVMTRDLAATFRGAIERAKLQYIVDCDTTPHPVFVDPDHWEKIFFNLVGNALKYTMLGSIQVKVEYTETEAVLSIQDSGVGVPKAGLSLLGERFHRAYSVSRSHEGTGIGLALAKELVKLHGGRLEIESRTAEESEDGSHGSLFTVTIPLGSDHLPPDAIDASESHTESSMLYAEGIVDEAMQWYQDDEGTSTPEACSTSRSSGSNSATPSSSTRVDPGTLYFKKEDTIMLVDDSLDTRRYIRSIFEPYCTLVEARNGREAIELCEKQRPDLIISDVMMPVLDGFGMLKELRAHLTLRLVPVIILTARGGDEAKVEGLLTGAEDYVSKPFNARELIARAHMQLQLGKKRQYLETAFEERTAEMRSIVEYSPGGIFRCDQRGSVTFSNSAIEELSGHSLGENLFDWTESVHTRDRERVRDFWRAVYNSSDLFSACEWQFENGTWVTANIIRLDVAAPGRLGGILGCVMDITERKMHEEMQRQRMIEAEDRRIAAEEAKTQQELLIDVTSHEIRNPISSLMQCSSLVKTNLLSLQEQLESAAANGQGFTPTKQLLTTINEDLDALESIYQCGLTQERISNDVLSLGRIQLDMLQMFDVETDIRLEAQKLISIFQNEARMKRIALSLKIGDSFEKLGVDYIKTDPVRLGQVVTNLLSNGIRFTSNSHVRRIQLQIDLSFEPPSPGSCVMPLLSNRPETIVDDMPVYLYMSVTDTGPGLTDAELKLLFQRFSQVSPKTHTIFGGSGLGLFVCRKITEIMGGRIDLASKRGHGSTFRFFIQAKTAKTQKSLPAPTPADSTVQAPTMKRMAGIKKGVSGPKPHVLIVEDNLINQTVLKRQLKHLGLTCEVANNGLEALEVIRSVARTDGKRVGKMFDCVLMDLEMPVMDGLTALKHIREEEAAGTMAHNVVIALTGNARQGQINAAKAAGMDEVVIKPYRLDDLLAKIEDMISIRIAKDEV